MRRNWQLLLPRPFIVVEIIMIIIIINQSTAHKPVEHDILKKR